MANNTDEENCGEDIWIYKKPYDKKPPLLWKQISYCWPLTAWNSKGNHHRLSSQCEYFKRRAISSSRRHDFTQSSAKMIFDWIYLNLFIYWNKNTTGKEIANWNVMFGTVAIQMSILDTNFPRFCLAKTFGPDQIYHVQNIFSTFGPRAGSYFRSNCCVCYIDLCVFLTVNVHLHTGLEINHGVSTLYVSTFVTFK